ncbi:MAG: peptidylprolyl isomerase [Hyphomicrobiales bacterium]|nr:MAG: peptidylprolyl isomerase [Hyphomicrobiales bacterium]
MPAEVQDQLLAQETTVSQIAGNLYARRAMADLAKAKGLEDDPQMVAALRVARDKILSDAWIAQIDSQHQITDAVAEGFARNAYNAKPDRFKVGDQVRVRHILVAGQTPEMRAQAEQLLDELKKGADFAQLAKDRSADKASGAKGGDLGFFERGRMLPEFEAAAFALRDRGQLSDVVSTQYGYHIIQLEESKPAGVRPFSEVRDELIKEVRGTVLQEARVAEAQRLQQGMQIQRDAVKDFTSGFPPVEVKRP